MSQDIGRHRFKAFPKWHAYFHAGKCAECFHERAFPLHTPTGPPAGELREDMTTAELLRAAAYLRLFQSPEDDARADTDEEE